MSVQLTWRHNDKLAAMANGRREGFLHPLMLAGPVLSQEVTTSSVTRLVHTDVTAPVPAARPPCANVWDLRVR